MSVIISEFEIVAEPAPEASSDRGAEAPPAGAEPPSPRPMDVEDIVERQALRQARLRAH